MPPDAPELRDSPDARKTAALLDLPKSTTDLENYLAYFNAPGPERTSMYLPALTVNDSNTVRDGSTTTTTVSNDGRDKHTITVRDGGKTIEFDDRKFEQKPDGTWKVSKGGAESSAEKVFVRGEGKHTEVVIQDGNKTTILRADGTTVTETKGLNGSTHSEIRNSKGELVGVVHNGRQYEIQGDKVYCRVNGYLSETNATIDKATGDIKFPMRTGDVTLKADGTTVVKDAATGNITIGYADGSRIYKDSNDRVIGLRDANRNYITIKDGIAQVKMRDGNEAKDHPLHGKKVEALPVPPGALKVADVPEPGKSTVCYLDGHRAVFQKVGDKEHCVAMTGKDGTSYVIARNPAKPEEVTSVQGPFGTIARGPDIKEIKVDSQAGSIRVERTDGSITQYKLGESTVTTTQGNRESTEYTGKNYGETRNNGQLQELRQKDLQWQVTMRGDTVARVAAGNVEFDIDKNAQSIKIKDGVITVQRKDGVVMVFNPDKTAEVRVPASLSGFEHTVRMTLDGQGRPVTLNDGSKANNGKGNEYAVVWGPSGIEKLTVNGVEYNRSTVASIDYKDGKFVVVGRDNKTLTFDPERATSCQDTAGGDLLVSSQAGTFEVTRKNGVAEKVAVTTPDGKKLAYDLPPGATITGTKTAPDGTITLDLKFPQDKTGKLTIDVTRNKATIETPVSRVEITPNSRVYVEMSDGKPVSGSIQRPGQDRPTFTFKYAADGSIDEVRGPNSEVLGKARPGQVAIALQGEDIVFKTANLTVKLHPDRSRDIYDAGGTRLLKRRDSDGFLVESGPTRFEYHQVGGRREEADGRAVPALIKFDNGAELRRVDGNEILAEGRPTSFEFVRPGQPTLTFVAATVDKEGVTHLKDAQGALWKLSPDGKTLTPERPVAPLPGPVPGQPPYGGPRPYAPPVVRPGQPYVPSGYNPAYNPPYNQPYNPYAPGYPPSAGPYNPYAPGYPPPPGYPAPSNPYGPGPGYPVGNPGFNRPYDARVAPPLYNPRYDAPLPPGAPPQAPWLMAEPGSVSRPYFWSRAENGMRITYSPNYIEVATPDGRLQSYMKLLPGTPIPYENGRPAGDNDWYDVSTGTVMCAERIPGGQLYRAWIADQQRMYSNSFPDAYENPTDRWYAYRGMSCRPQPRMLYSATDCYGRPVSCYPDYGRPATTDPTRRALFANPRRVFGRPRGGPPVSCSVPPCGPPC